LSIVLPLVAIIAPLSLSSPPLLHKSPMTTLHPSHAQLTSSRPSSRAPPRTLDSHPSWR
jgi:hypothetical protein